MSHAYTYVGTSLNEHNNVTMTVDDTRTLFDGIERHNIIFWEKGRAAVSQCKRLMSLHGMTIYVTEYVTSVPEFVGRVVMFFKVSVGPGVHTSHSDVRSLAFVEEYCRLPPQPSDTLCSNSDVYGYTLPPLR